MTERQVDRMSALLTLCIDVSDYTAAEVGRLRGLVNDFEATRAAAPGRGREAGTAPDSETHPDRAIWDAAVSEALQRLSRHHRVQARVIEEALASPGGFVERDRVYEIGDYPPSRSLKGLTRPINRVVADLKDEGTFPHSVKELLAPVYDPKVTGFQKALGFKIPEEILGAVTDSGKDTSPC